MSLQPVTWTSQIRLSCAGCGTTETQPDVILCVTPSKVLPFDPSGAEKTTVDAQLINSTSFFENNCDCRCPTPVKTFEYAFVYDDTQLVPGQLLEASDISGVVCRGCLTNYIDNEISGTGADLTEIFERLAALEAQVLQVGLDISALGIIVESLITQVNTINSQIIILNSEVADLQNGWILVTELWTYSAPPWTFGNAVTTANPGAQSRYANGSRVKLIQDGIQKYFYLTTFGASLLYLYAGDDYTITNTPITDVYVSREQTPLTFPQVFNWTPGITVRAGSGTANITIRQCTFTVQSADVYFTVDLSVDITTLPTDTISVQVPLPAISNDTCHALISDGASSPAYVELENAIAVIFPATPPSIVKLWRQGAVDFSVATGTEVRIQGFYPYVIG